MIPGIAETAVSILRTKLPVDAAGLSSSIISPREKLGHGHVFPRPIAQQQNVPHGSSDQRKHCGLDCGRNAVSVKKYRIKLTPEEQQELPAPVSRERAAAYRQTQARILLLCDEAQDGGTMKSRPRAPTRGSDLHIGFGELPIR